VPNSREGRPAGSLLLAAAAVALAGIPAAGIAALPLPLPAAAIPREPPLVPAVVTAGGRRLLLGHAPEVRVRYDARTGRLAVSPAGWWVINFPLDRIEGAGERGADAMARLLFGRPEGDVRNWYAMTPGRSPREPAPPAGPAPIGLAPAPTFVVDAGHPAADDGNPGAADRPLRTISAAVARAGPGTVIRVRPGIYRESFTVTASGEPGRPVTIEGERGPDGRMPVVTGNDPFPAGAWKRWPGRRGVWRADLFTGLMGTVSAGGKTLVERDLPHELEPGEYCFNRGSRGFLDLMFGGNVRPRAGAESHRRAWRKVLSDADGFLDLSAAGDGGERGAVWWVSSWVWMPQRDPDQAWDPRFPQPLTGRIEIGGEFRAARMNGSGLGDQVNVYRAWVNGARLPAYVRSGKDRMALDLPHPGRNHGFSDEWQNFPLREGWNHLVFQLDTASRPAKTRFRFAVPRLWYQRKDGSWYEEARPVVSSAEAPAGEGRPGSGEARPFCGEWLVLGPFPSVADLGVYVRLAGDADPGGASLDLSARGSHLAVLAGDFVRLRGLEIRHGAQFQQRAQVRVTGRGCEVEGCLVRDSEVKGIELAFGRNHVQGDPPGVVRGNWVVNPGNVGIGCGGTSEFLTPANQDGEAPGRGPVLIEHNVIVNNNWAGFDPFWESGGLKLFHLTGSVIRYNTVAGGSGPGLWFDWEHYNNRVEGNLFVDGWAFGIGVEASPGPMLLANNVVVNLRPGQVWFRFGLLEWSSDRVWFLHNTIDGRWNRLPAWHGLDGADGIYAGEGGNDRGTRWGNLAGRTHAVLNNVVTGCDEAVQVRRESRPADAVAGNFTDRGRGAEARRDLPGAFRNPGGPDYRLKPGSALSRAGMENDLLRHVRHDFNGLPRFPGDGITPGAFRTEPPAGKATRIEVEFEDGIIRRL